MYSIHCIYSTLYPAVWIRLERSSLRRTPFAEWWQSGSVAPIANPLPSITRANSWRPRLARLPRLTTGPLDGGRSERVLQGGIRAALEELGCKRQSIQEEHSRGIPKASNLFARLAQHGDEEDQSTRTGFASSFFNPIIQLKCGARCRL